MPAPRETNPLQNQVAHHVNSCSDGGLEIVFYPLKSRKLDTPNDTRMLFTK
jgi:hypothetical protein